MVGALYVMNQAYGCSSSGPATPASPATRAYDVPADVSANDATRRRWTRATTSHPEALDNPDAADAAVAGEEFIFDVQTHTRVPAPPWTAATCT
jgi:hypothetical protein